MYHVNLIPFVFLLDNQVEHLVQVVLGEAQIIRRIPFGENNWPGSDLTLEYSACPHYLSDPTSSRCQQLVNTSRMLANASIFFLLFVFESFFLSYFFLHQRLMHFILDKFNILVSV